MKLLLSQKYSNVCCLFFLMKKFLFKSFFLIQGRPLLYAMFNETAVDKQKYGNLSVGKRIYKRIVVVFTCNRANMIHLRVNAYKEWQSKLN